MSTEAANTSVEGSRQKSIAMEEDVVSSPTSTPLNLSNGIGVGVGGSDAIDLTAALCVRNAFKGYQKGSKILDDFNMTVPAGCIYSLLGSSGCGKTTILSCCVGIRKLDKGTIRIFGHVPGTKGSGVPGRKVGFMPQDLSLYNELTIQEAMHFYGRIYGMTRDQLKESTSFLIDFLDLPAPTRKIGNLSGGQKRRVSMALTLIHDPELLILDEPTVGVDPLLREGIWSHLVKLVKTGRTTVIITTHYVQEARQSDMVGIMRSGRLLVEKSPANLISEFNVNNLEDIVLALCRLDREEKKAGRAAAKAESVKPRKGMALLNCFNLMKPKGGSIQPKPDKFPAVGLQDESVPFMTPSQPQPTPSENSVSNVTLSDSGKVNRKNSRPKAGRKLSARENIRLRQSTPFKRLIALLIKNFITLMRNIGFLLFIFLVPAIQIVLICYTMGSDPRGLLLSVVNYETCNFQSGNWRSISNTCPINNPQNVQKDVLSCFYLSVLPEESFILERMDTSSDAIERMRSGYAYGYIQFPAGYTQSVMCRFALGGLRYQAVQSLVQLLGPGYSCGINVNSSIILNVDMSNKHIGQTMKRIFIDTYAKVLAKIRKNCRNLPNSVDIDSATSLPYEFQKPLYGKDDTSFREFLAPSILLGLLFFFPLCSSAVSYITEKKAGTLDRALVAGVTTPELMGGFLVTQVGILLGQAGFAFLILTQVFSIEVVGSVPLALTLTVLVGISGMSAGFLIAMFCEEEVQAVLLAIGTFFPNILLAGMVWPLEGMAKALQYMSYVLPCTLACESMRSIIGRGWGFEHRKVWPGFLTTLTWILVYWLLALSINKFKSK